LFDERLGPRGELADIGLGDLVVGADGLALVAQLVRDEGREENDGQILEHPVFLDAFGQVVPVHGRHFDIGHHDLDIVGDRTAFHLGFFLDLEQKLPGLASVLHGRDVEARLLQQILEHLPHQDRVVGHERPIAAGGVPLDTHVQTQSQVGVEIGHDFFQVEEKNDAVLQLDHAGDAVAAHLGDIAVGRFHGLPTHAVDAGDARNEERGGHVVEFRDDDLGRVAILALLVQPDTEVHQGNDVVAQIERAHDAGVAHLGHARDLGESDNLQDLGDVDAVIAPVLAGGGLGCVARKGGRRGFVDVELHDFQFIGTGFKQNVGLGHGRLRGLPLG